MPLDLTDDAVKAEVDAIVTAKLAETTAGLAKNKAELLAEKKALEARLKTYPEDFDPDVWAKAKAPPAGGARTLAEQDAQHKAQLAAQKAREDKITVALHRRLREGPLTEAIRKLKGDPEYVLHHGMPHVQVREAGDDWQTYVANPDGSQRYDGRGEPVTVEALAAELRDKYPRAFEGSGSSGSGAAGGAGSGGAAVDANDPVAMGKAADAWLKAQKTKR